MNTTVAEKLNLFIDNYLILRKPLAWSAHDLYIRLCALTLAMKNQKANAAAIQAVAAEIKQSTRWTSPFRGSSKIPISGFLVAGQQAHSVSELLHTADLLKASGFKNGEPLTYAAHALMTLGEPAQHRDLSDRAWRIFNDMKANHPWLTAQTDYPAAVVLACSNLSTSDIVVEAEAVYSTMKEKGFQKSDGLQYLSHLMVFDPSLLHQKTDRCEAIANEMKYRKMRTSSMFYGTVGIIALTGDRWQTVVDEVEACILQLKTTKHFRFTGRELNTLMVAGLVATDTLSESNMSAQMFRTGVSSTIQAIIAAQMAATTAAFVAASSAAASS